MFRQHAKLFTSLQLVADLLLSAAAFLSAYFTRIAMDGHGLLGLSRWISPQLHSLAYYLPWIGLALGFWVIAAFMLNLFRITFRRLTYEKIKAVVESSILMGLFVGFVSFAMKLEISRPVILFFVFYQILFLLAARFIVELHNRRQKSDWAIRNILIVGNSEKARRMGDLIWRYRDWGLKILGYVSTKEDAGSLNQQDVIGAIDDLPRIIQSNVVDEIIFVSGETKDLAGLDEALLICQELGIKTRIAVDLFPAKISKISIDFHENIPLLTFSMTPDHAFSLFIKRVLDVVLSAFLLLISLPFMLIVALVIRLTSKGPAIYMQVRCGLYGRKFVLYKFRSMCDGAEDVLWEIKHLNEMGGPVFKMSKDPRMTPIGKYLRKFSIDEWPQFWNVLKGDMSLVGPRAPLPLEVEEYTRWQRRRLSVKPGITCLWQVSGRNNIDFSEWMKLDLQYIDNWSLGLDLKILLRTFPVVIFCKGAK